MMLTRLHVALIVLSLFITGCGAGRTLDVNAPPPQRWSLTLRSASNDSRYTWFELDKAGQLIFGGGRLATARAGVPVTQLDQPQRDALWKIIAEHQLLSAKSEPFKKPKQVVYELTLSTPAGSNTVRTLDNTNPGIVRLHDALFDLQASVRYQLPEIQKGMPGPDATR